MFIVNHGFELDKFISANREAVDVLGERYNPSHRFPVIGVISRFTEWKGVQYIIPAFKKLLQDYPNALMILANAKGDMQVEINEMLNQLPENSYRTIEFERDIASLYRLFDIFVHVPVDKFAEAFGQTYVESLASGVPSVVTLSGIACEFVRDRCNALVVPYRNSDEIYKAAVELLSNVDLRTRLIEKGVVDVKQRFPVEVMMNALYTVYEA